jgi:uncharacterized protein DUF1638
VRLKLIGCEVLYREFCAAVARSPHQVDIGFLPKGLHDLGAAPMVGRLQSEVDTVDPERYEGILLGYGLCGMGVAGLVARRIPLVLPRAHDCITLFLGAKERYLDYFNQHPGVYFKTSGWIERGAGTDEINQNALRRQGFALTHNEMVAKYGEENAAFLEQELLRYRTSYTQFTFIEMGVEPDDRFERCTIEEAALRGWHYEKVQGDMALIEGLVNGDWDPEKYLVVPPGHRIVARYDDGIIGAEIVQE